MQVRANGIALEVDVRGPAQGEPLLLIMGLGMQLTAWHEGLVDLLVARGFRVIRFDNRDVGLSQAFDEHRVPNLGWQSMKHLVGLPVSSAYTLADMADDCAALLDALRIASAHVCGASMGGMIAQRLAALHPQRVKSLTLIMTTSGARHLPGPAMKVRGALLSRPARPARPADVDSVVDHYCGLYRLIGSPGYPADEAWRREWLARSVRRSHRPQGTARQLLAIAADGDRSALLKALRVPTQIIHGAADPLVPVPAAHDLLAKVPGAVLDVVDGMGHDLPPPLWPRFASGIAAAAARA